MEPGLTTAAFGTKAQSAIANKNAEFRREISSSGDKMIVTDTSGRKHTVATKQTTTTVTRPAGSKSSRVGFDKLFFFFCLLFYSHILFCSPYYSIQPDLLFSIIPHCFFESVHHVHIIIFL